MLLKQKESTALRNEQLANLIELLESQGNKVLITASGDVAVEIAVTAEDGTEGMVGVKYSVSVPKGPRGGDGWDAKAEAELYAEDLARKAEEAKVKADKKAKKIAKDKALREAKEANKA